MSIYALVKCPLSVVVVGPKVRTNPAVKSFDSDSGGAGAADIRTSATAAAEKCALEKAHRHQDAGAEIMTVPLRGTTFSF